LTRLRVVDGALHESTFTVRDGLASNSIATVHVGRDGTVWAGTDGAGVSMLRPGEARFVTETVADGLASNIVHTIGETTDGTVWLGTSRGLAARRGGGWRTFDVADGLPPGAVNVLLGAETEASLWAGTTFGLVRLVDGLPVSTPLPNVLRDTIVGLAEDRHGSLWIATSTRLLQVSVDRLRRGVADEGDIREFELNDGLRSLEATRREHALVRAPDGRLWLSTTRGLAVVDPQRLPPRTPAVAGVRAILVDGVPLNLFGPSPLRIGPNRERVAFALDAVSLTYPQHVRIRYRLDGIDRDWSAATTAREAIYTHLGPGPYPLRVMSSTRDGRWRDSDDAVAFVVEPAFWQTRGFRLLVVALVGALALVAYRLRTRQLTRQLNVRFEERLEERTRIAQELHDTLLQGVLSVSMQLHSAIDDLPPDTPNRQELEGLLAQMGRVSDEGRAAVRGLRTPSADDLEQAFCGVQLEYASRSSADFEVTVEGRVRPIHPLIRDEVYRIGREALVNAFRHARAGRIQMELEYGPQRLRMLVRDDGHGMDPEVLDAGRDGHWGLTGMKERAQRIGGELTLASRVGAGTEVELLLPASVAFSRSKEHDHG
jgi:signal transduction histidine kinase